MTKIDHESPHVLLRCALYASDDVQLDLPAELPSLRPGAEPLMTTDDDALEWINKTDYYIGVVLVLIATHDGLVLSASKPKYLGPGDKFSIASLRKVLEVK